LVAEGEENNLAFKVQNERWKRWYSCSLCEQEYHGVVRCALGWACWKTYVGRPEADWARGAAMTELGLGLSAVNKHEDAVSVGEAELAILRRLGDTPDNILSVQSNLACTYSVLGREEEALDMRQKVYSGRLKLGGEEDEMTLNAACNYATSFYGLDRFEEATSLFRKTIPVARRVLGEAHEITLGMRQNYAQGLLENSAATLDDLREAVTTLEETERTRRRVFGGAHPLTTGIDVPLRKARARLRAREAGFDSVREALEAMTAGDA
jgi:tetratricopeptide (TPR) repeat protein